MPMDCVPHIRVVAAVIEKHGRFLITQRRAGGSLGGLWEFPSGKVEESESDEAALHRELRERVDVSIEVGEKLAGRTHCYDRYMVDLVLYRARLAPGQEPHPVGVDDLRWVAAGELENYRFPPADQGTTDALLGIRGAPVAAGASKAVPGPVGTEPPRSRYS
jgi:8-oxo-dGTP diphosphatase